MAAFIQDMEEYTGQDYSSFLQVGADPMLNPGAGAMGMMGMLKPKVPMNWYVSLILFSCHAFGRSSYSMSYIFEFSDAIYTSRSLCVVYLLAWLKGVILKTVNSDQLVLTLRFCVLFYLNSFQVRPGKIRCPNVRDGNWKTGMRHL